MKWLRSSLMELHMQDNEDLGNKTAIAKTFDLSDALGHVLAAQTLSFTDSQRLVSGRQTVAFSSVKIDQVESGITISMYEQIDTPNGITKRLVKVLNN